jgi:hypothetical protein
VEQEGIVQVGVEEVAVVDGEVTTSITTLLHRTTIKRQSRDRVMGQISQQTKDGGRDSGLVH